MKNTKAFILYGLTVFTIVFTIIWEYYIRQWEATQSDGGDTVVRVDQFVLYPLIITLVALSLYRLLGKRK